MQDYNQDCRLSLCKTVAVHRCRILCCVLFVGASSRLEFNYNMSIVKVMKLPHVGPNVTRVHLSTVLSSSPCTVHCQGLHRRHQFCLPQGSKATPNLRRFVWPFDQVFLHFVAEFCFHHPKHSSIKMHKIPQVLPPQGSKARHFTIQWSD